MTANARKATAEMVADANPPDGYEAILSNSPFGWENGPIFERITTDGKQRGFRVAEKHINAGGACHGGMIMTFADILLATAVFEISEPPFVTVRMTTDFIGPAFKGEWLSGTASAVVAGDGMVAVKGIMRVDDRVVAAASGLFKALRFRG
ncbi:PaaI family thioesterase [Kordiimonas aestuarii]|uniref:PaaI family thioesterase n=1 Tax=Kordiimonas aestuarii TaxID=1005925 RepID=UPI0021CDFE8B|nr:PaaI family thioesterase [Kordiimonas aestuarii]